MCSVRRFVFACGLSLLSCNLTIAEDWPQWMGIHRDGRWTESGVVTEIGNKPLPVRWRTAIGEGYSGPAVAQGRVLVTDYLADKPDLLNNPGQRDNRTGNERVLCLDLETGKQLWVYQYSRPYKISYAAGPRATPTVAGDQVFVLGAEGDLLCLKLDSGNLEWKKNLAEVYKAPTPMWGHSAHPLVHGDMLYCLAGGSQSVVVALDKNTGQEIWKSANASEIGYCPPSVVKIAGVEQLVIWHADAVCGLDLTTGKIQWEYPLAPLYKMSIAAPQFQGNRMFACGIGDTAAMVEFDGQGLPSTTVWKGVPKQCLYSGNATPLWIDNTIYGADCQSGQFVAVDSKTGKRLWETFDLTTGVPGRRASHGTAFLVYNNGFSYLLAETGDLIIAKLSPDSFKVTGKMKVLEPTGECFGRPVVWSHPAFADRAMLARNDKEIVCVDLSLSTNR